VHIGDAHLSAAGTDLIIHGNILPASGDTFSIGSAEKRLQSIHIGPGTVFIGPTGTLGNDPNGIVYAEGGFAAPTLVLGATIPGATGPVGGGMRLSVTGSTGPLQYQQLGPEGGPTGPVYTVAHTVPGTDAPIPSGFTGDLSGTPPITLSDSAGTATLFCTTSIQLHTSSRMWAMASIQFTITTNSPGSVSFYLEVNGETSNTTTFTWRNGNNNESNTGQSQVSQSESSVNKEEFINTNNSDPFSDDLPF
jgi:hypothetical protein